MNQLQTVVTEKCNLNCKYCYMKHVKNDMTLETFKEGIEFFHKKISSHLNSHSFGTALAFFGGEPLLNLNLIKSALKERDKYQVKQTMVITNGLLLNEKILRFLDKNLVGLSLSFDGPGNENIRVLSNGKSSLDKYSDFHFDFMRSRGMKVMIGPDSVHNLTNIYNFFTENNILFPDFSFVRDNIYSDNHLKILKNELQNLTDKVLENSKKGILSVPGFYTLYILDTIIGKKKGKRPFGCFAGTHGVGFMPNGKMYPCARFGSADKLCLGDVNTGRIDKEVFDFINQTHNPVNFEQCKKCSLYLVCNAGCSYSQLEFGNWEKMVPVESVCSILRMAYNESYKLFKKLKEDEQYINFINHKLKTIG